MAKRVMIHDNNSELHIVILLCVLSFIFGGLMALFLHPTLREIDSIKNKCLLTYSVSSKQDCKVKIVIDLDYDRQLSY